MEKKELSQVLRSQSRLTDLGRKLEAASLFQQRALNWVLLFVTGGRNAITDGYTCKSGGGVNQTVFSHLDMHRSEKSKDNT
jgi:hypothetical protein